MQQKALLQYPRQTHVIFVANTRQKTHLHTNCNITDAERENHMVKIRRFKIGKESKRYKKEKLQSDRKASDFGHPLLEDSVICDILCMSNESVI